MAMTAIRGLVPTAAIAASRAAAAASSARSLRAAPTAGISIRCVRSAAAIASIRIPNFTPDRDQTLVPTGRLRGWPRERGSPSVMHRVGRQRLATVLCLAPAMATRASPIASSVRALSARLGSASSAEATRRAAPSASGPRMIPVKRSAAPGTGMDPWIHPSASKRLVTASSSAIRGGLPLMRPG